jgi:UDP-N-acetylglucosamine 2-epimerase (non-hydrolysing)
MDTGGIVVTGIDPTSVVLAVRTVLAQRAEGALPPIPLEYEVTNTSQRVVNLIVGLARLHTEWSGIRPLL